MKLAIPLSAVLTSFLASATVIEKEVCVVGGGAAGAYSAYQLQKRGYNVVLFEPKSNLGGNCEILEFPSKLSPGTNYTVNAAVIIFSPKPAVTEFFAEFGATTGTLSLNTNEQSFVYGPGFVIPTPPPQDLTSVAQALGAFVAIVSQPPYLGTAGTSPVPDWDNLTPLQRGLLLETYADFEARHPVIAPLTPIISSLMQGFGYVYTRPMWELLAFGGPAFLTQIFSGTFLTLDNGCQAIYDDLADRMLAIDPHSVKLNTYVRGIKQTKRQGGTKGVSMQSTAADGTKTNYKCGDAIMAFRPNGIDNTLLKDMTSAEQAFFNDLGYNGYIPSVWEMDLGPSLLAVGANPNNPIRFNNASIVDVGIMTLSKDRPESDYPWRLFYQPREPANTPAKLQVIRDKIVSDLTAIGFVNIKNLFISNHAYSVKPQSEANTLQWTNFFNAANSDGDRLFWVGSVPAGEGSENVWFHAKQLIDARFPDK